MWVLDHLEDLDADFLAFYRIDGIESLTGPRFLSLALRVFAYQGVMAARATAEQEARNPTRGALTAVTSREGGVKQVESSKAAITADPALGPLVSWGTG